MPARAPVAPARARSAPAPVTAPARGPAKPGRPAAPPVALGHAPALRLAPGRPLASSIRDRLEKTFATNLAAIRVHDDDRAQRSAQALQTRAFAHGPDIYLGPGESAEDLALISHEVAHTLQQVMGPQVQKYDGPHSGLEVEARQASQAAVSGGQHQVQGRTSPRVQAFGALDYLADKANLIPGFRMFTVLLGRNPINWSTVERSPANVLRALIEFIPGGALVTQALDNHHVFEKVSAWVGEQAAALGLSAQAIKDAISAFISSLGWSDLANLGGVWDRAKKIFSDPIDRIIAFAKALITGMLKLIKEAILKPLAKLAEGTAGYDLLKGVLGKDPVTDEPYTRTPENLLGPFLKLIGQEEMWENMQKAKAIPRLWSWFQTALPVAIGFVSQIPALFVAAFKALELADIILLPRAFQKLAGVFGSFLGKFATWAGNALWTLLEIVFDVVSPGAWGYIKKTGAALKSILKNPLPFIGNLVKAAKLGFENFGKNFLTHLKNGLLNWLLGALPGVYIPKAFQLGEVVKFAFSVLGLTWAQFRQKLVKATSETVVSAMETAVDIVVVLVRDGPAAAWDRIKEELVSLKDKVIDGIKDFVVDTVVKKAIPKLISLFIPGAGFITAIIAIYDTIMVFVNKIAQIMAVVKGFIDSIVAIAGGAIAAAAAKVEGILAGLLSLAINFLAGFIGLGKVADKIMGVITKIRDTIDKALDKLVNVVVNAARKLWGKAKAAVSQWWKAKKSFTTAEGEKHTLEMQGEGSAAKLIMKSDPVLYRNFVTALKEPAAAKGKKAAALKIVDELDAAVAKAVKASAAAAAKPVPPDPKNDPAVEIQKILDRLSEATAPLLSGDSKTVVLQQKTQSLGGSTVGVGMSIDWLGPKYPVGTPPAASAQTALMGLLVTEPTERSADKYIRGHLLNENLGGLGNDLNLFPITGNANSQHLHSTESKVKTWAQTKKKWVFYEVNVGDIVSKLDPKKKKDPANYVNCVFSCHAIRKDADGKKEEEFTSKITSKFTVKLKAERTEVPLP